ncbi:MAG: Hpy99I family type II restriction endonuclease [Flavobacteriales bacterium]|nr:Hpy99I family type II restriction endonuclease [Flavobacteriales bacterium]
MTDIKKFDFVILAHTLGHVPQNAVGIVGETDGATATVFFIGIGEEVSVPEESLHVIEVRKTGKGFQYKICNLCHILKEHKEFDINQTDGKGIKTSRPSCKTCRVAIDGLPLKPSERKRLDQSAPNRIFTCPICQKTTIVGVTGNQVKDHDHITGNARAWICDSCNTGLGRFKDDIGFLQVAIDYLKKYNSNSGSY